MFSRRLAASLLSVALLAISCGAPPAAAAATPPPRRPPTPGLASRVFGGSAPTSPWQFPYYVWLGHCGGTLIDPLVVLTAAHCIYKQPDPVEVFVGPDQERHAVAGWALHPDYAKSTRTGVKWDGARRDVALVFLEEPVEYVRPAPRVRAVPPPGTRAFHMGRGAAVEGGDVVDELLYGNFQLTARADGFPSYPELLSARGDTSSEANGRCVACARRGVAAACWGAGGRLGRASRLTTPPARVLRAAAADTPHAPATLAAR